MKLNFVKMQGTGNDFIMVDYDFSDQEFSEIAKKLCDRNFGIGADGLIAVLPAKRKINDYKMRIFNQDGSEAEMCGNGIRCFTHYLKKIKNINQKIFSIETMAGVIKPELISSNQRKSIIDVKMGSPSFSPEDIPIKVKNKFKSVDDYLISIDDKKFKVNCVSMGNPHTVIFVKDLNDQLPQKWGKLIENYPIFPERTNVEFIKILSNSKIKMEVWERGNGRTLACGTGACAAVAVGIKNKNLAKRVQVQLPGGSLMIDWTEESMWMRGPAVTVFKGCIEINTQF